MSASAAVWLVIFVAAIAANLPFANNRLFAVGPAFATKRGLWRLLELLAGWGATLGVGFALEARQGQIAPQHWEFFAGFGFMFLTLAFPGFVWRYLMKRRST